MVSGPVTSPNERGVENVLAVDGAGDRLADLEAFHRLAGRVELQDVVGEAGMASSCRFGSIPARASRRADR